MSSTTESQALFYPVSGCAGLDNRQAADYQHRWFVVDAQGQWLSAQRCPGLLGVLPTLHLGYLVLRAPGMLRIDIPLDVIEDDDSVKRTVTVGTQAVIVVDEGDIAATWMSHVAGEACRVVKVHPEARPIQWPVSL